MSGENFLSRGFQHMLQQDAVALGGVIHQHMGHCAHKAPVLDDGAIGLGSGTVRELTGRSSYMAECREYHHARSGSWGG